MTDDWRKRLKVDGRYLKAKGHVGRTAKIGCPTGIPYPPVFFVSVADKGLKLAGERKGGRERTQRKAKLRTDS
jgi:hypothetical protein